LDNPLSTACNVNTTYKQHKMSKVFFIACSKFEPKIKEKKDK
jgi:hypothetical protein